MKTLSFWTFVLGFVGLHSGCTRSDSGSNLFIYSTMDEPLIQNLTQAYLSETGTRVRFVRLSTGEAAARIETERNNPQASLWLGGMALNHQQLKERGLSEPYQSPAFEKIPAEFKDADGYWAGLYIGILAFASNIRQLERLEAKAPQSWEELTHEKFRNQIQLANLGTSGTSYNVLAALIKQNGEEAAMEYFRRLHPNVAQYTRSGSAPAKNTAIGETTVAVGYAHDILRLIHEDRAAIEISFPSEGTGYEIAAMSLIKGGKQPDLARNFYEWMHQKTASQILADYYVTPIMRNDAKLKEKAVGPEDVKLIHLDMEWAGQNRERLVNLWNEKINS